MKKLSKVYLLDFIDEFEDGHDDVILLGVFSSKAQATAMQSKLRGRFGAKRLSKQITINACKMNSLFWKEGFITVK